MTTEVLEQDPTEIGQSQPIYGYYIKADGWVTVGVTSPMERLHFIEEGWKYLSQYGLFDMTTGYAANNPFELLFIRGGAKEMPLEQVIESGFHVKTPTIPRCKLALNQNHKKHRPSCWPAIEVEFPQLANGKPPVYPCSFDTCPRFQPGQEFPTSAARTNHETVMHKEERLAIRTGTILGDNLLRGFGRKVPGDTSVLDILGNVGLTVKQKEALKAAGILED